jgi:hypothetical protein
MKHKKNTIERRIDDSIRRSRWQNLPTGMQSLYSDINVGLPQMCCAATAGHSRRHTALCYVLSFLFVVVSAVNTHIHAQVLSQNRTSRFVAKNSNVSDVEIVENVNTLFV